MKLEQSVRDERFRADKPDVPIDWRIQQMDASNKYSEENDVPRRNFRLAAWKRVA